MHSSVTVLLATSPSISALRCVLALRSRFEGLGQDSRVRKVVTARFRSFARRAIANVEDAQSFTVRSPRPTLLDRSSRSV